ncbi:C40 family peptidase [Candidatus Uhrbacteria bacterium]|nr:C40 family peptidase [Candidatus Uhrbacteria bacterium]
MRKLLTAPVVAGRLAVDFRSLKLPISDALALDILLHKGFRQMRVEIVRIALNQAGRVRYCRGAAIEKAPGLVDCSSFTKWVYGQAGIFLPRRSIQQRECGQPVRQSAVRPGDLLFTSGRNDWYHDDPADGVGHVGILTDRHTVVHAADEQSGVIESSLDEFTRRDKFRGARRITDLANLVTLEVPDTTGASGGPQIEILDDLKWVIVQDLPEELRKDVAA